MLSRLLLTFLIFNFLHFPLGRLHIPMTYSKPQDCKADVPSSAPSTVMMKRMTSAITFFLFSIHLSFTI